MGERHALPWGMASLDQHLWQSTGVMSCASSTPLQDPFLDCQITLSYIWMNFIRWFPTLLIPSTSLSCPWMFLGAPDSQPRTKHEKHQNKLAAGLRALVLCVPAVLGNERRWLSSKKPSLQMDGAQPALGQPEPVPDRADSRRHAHHLHRGLSAKRHHSDACHAGRPQCRALWGGNSSDSPSLDDESQLEQIG